MRSASAALGYGDLRPIEERLFLGHSSSVISITARSNLELDFLPNGRDSSLPGVPKQPSLSACFIT